PSASTPARVNPSFFSAWLAGLRAPRARVRRVRGGVRRAEAGSPLAAAGLAVGQRAGGKAGPRQWPARGAGAERTNQRSVGCLQGDLRMRNRVNRAFTLVEILIVVVILGILAAIVIPQFTTASEEAQVGNVQTQLQTMRSQ